MFKNLIHIVQAQISSKKMTSLDISTSSLSFPLVKIQEKKSDHLKGNWKKKEYVKHGRIH